MSQEVMDLKQLASFLGRDARELGKLANRGYLPGRKVGGEWRFSTAEIQSWVENELPRWTDEELRAIDPPAPQTSPQLLVTSLLPIECIDLNFSARTKNSALRDLVHLADRSGRLWDLEAILKSIESRESRGSTAWPGGFATPHPHRRLPYAQGESVLAFARSPGGIAFGAGRDGLTDLFFLVCCVDDAEHLRVLSRLSRMFRRDEFATALRSAESPGDVLDALANAESQLSQPG
jgi:PTS system nitrogen regulatory IIA component